MLELVDPRRVTPQLTVILAHPPPPWPPPRHIFYRLSLRFPLEDHGGIYLDDGDAVNDQRRGLAPLQ